MMYITEPCYFNKNSADFTNIFKITAQVVAQWCDWYEAKLIMPVKGVAEAERSGMLPDDPNKKQHFIEELTLWLLNNSQSHELFKLHLDSNPIGQRHKFEHHDDTCCWYLNLSEDEFKKLQESWKKNNFPEDLFYPAENTLRLLKPLSFFGKFMTSLGFTWQSFDLYSPKRWEEELKKNPESIKKLSRHIPL